MSENSHKALRIFSLMSGTSADGIDGVLAEFELKEGNLQWHIVDRLSTTYTPNLRQNILACLKVESSNVLTITEVHTEVGQAYASVVKEMQSKHQFDYVALSGQTVYHIPRVDQAMDWRTVSTLQLGEAAVVTENCNIPVVSDFRQSDMAAGGQGAPMVSFGDYQMFSKVGSSLSIHNLGGISNLTYLPAKTEQADTSTQVFAFDTGPASCLIDEAVKQHFGLEYDKDGLIAASGTVHVPTLESLMQHPYLSLPLPKTTGRETFTLDALENYLSADLEPKDLVATLTAFTAESIARAYRDYVLDKGLNEIYVAGGGAFNTHLMSLLRDLLNIPIKTFENLGYDSRDREALSFGVMAYFRVLGKANTLPSATGARKATVAGKISIPVSAG